MNNAHTSETAIPSFLPRVLAASLPEKVLDALAQRYDLRIANNLEELFSELASGQVRLCVVSEAMDRIEEGICGCKQDDALSDVPILVIADHLSHERLFKLGADAFISCQENTHVLMNKVDLLLGLTDSQINTSACVPASPFEEVMRVSRILAPGFSMGTVESLQGERRLPDDVSLTRLVSIVEGEIGGCRTRSDVTGEDADDIDDIDVQGYVAHQLSAGERRAAFAVGRGGDDDGDDEDEDEDEDGNASPAAHVGQPPSEEATLLDGEQSEPAGAEDPSLGADDPREERAFGPEEALGGELERTPFWQILARLYSGRYSGVLTVSDRDVVREILVDDGQLLLVSSNAKEDRLVDLLYREGRLSHMQYATAASMIVSSGRRAGVVMVEKGYITSRELFPLVRHHYETLILDCFGMSRGTWRFESRSVHTDERILLDKAMPDFIMEGIRTRANVETVLRLMPETAVVSIAPQGQLLLRSLSVTEEEQDILHGCNGVRTVAMLAAHKGVDILELRRLLAGLRVIGVLQIDGKRNDSLAPVPSGNGDEGSGACENAMDLAMERARIERTMKVVQDGTYYDVLDVDPESPQDVVDGAYERLKRCFLPERFDGIDADDLKAQCEVINVVLDEARSILGSSALRRKYDDAIQRQTK